MLTANNTPSDSMLWQICADETPIDINGQEIFDPNPLNLEPTDRKSFFYVPKRFNETVTWSSSNQYVADISQDGILTALGAGTTLISVEADVLGSKSTYYSSITVVLPNGLYRLTNDANGMWMDLHYDKVAENTPVQIYNNADCSLDNPSMIFKIHHLGAGLYSIRSMRKNDMGVCCENQSVVLKSIGTSHTAVLNEGKWCFGSNGHGTYIYLYSNGISSTITVPLNAASSDDLIIDTYSADNQRQAWHFSSVNSVAPGAQSKLYIENDLGDMTVGNVYSFDGKRIVIR